MRFNKTISYFVKRIIPFLLLSFLLSSGFYDHTVLSGEIIIPDSVLAIGNKYKLSLEIPSDLDEIYWIVWEVEPADSASITFEICSGSDCGKNSAYKGDRSAIIMPLKPGTIEIIVSGFYKQTNPQLISRKEVLLVELK